MCNLNHPKSCGLGWVIVAASFVIMLVTSIHIHMTAVLLKELAEEFQLPATEMGSLAAVRAGLLQFVGILVGPFVNKFGCRLVALCAVLLSAIGTFATAFSHDKYSLFIFFGIISATGGGSTFIPASVIVQRHFTDKRALAFGIASSGMSAGSFLTAPLVHQLVLYYGWRGGMIIVAGIFVQFLVAAMLFFPPPKNPPPKTVAMKSNNDAETEDHSSPAKSSVIQKAMTFLGIDLLSNKLFLLFLIAALPIDCGIVTYVYLAITRALEQGIPGVQASFINSAFGISSLLGRLMSGCFGSLKGANRGLYFSLTVIITGLLTCLSCLAGSSFALHIIFIVVFGLFFGQQHSLYPTVLVDVLTSARLPKAMGLVCLVKGLAAFICLAVTGSIYEVTKSYTAPFIAMGSATILGGIIAFPVGVSFTCTKNLQKSTTDLESEGLQSHVDITEA